MRCSRRSVYVSGEAPRPAVKLRLSTGRSMLAVGSSRVVPAAALMGCLEPRPASEMRR